MSLVNLNARQAAGGSAAYTGALPRALYDCRSVATAARAASRATSWGRGSDSVRHRPLLRYTRRRVRRRALTYIANPELAAGLADKPTSSSHLQKRGQKLALRRSRFHLTSADALLVTGPLSLRAARS